MLVDKFPTMPCVYMTTKKKYFTGENFCGLAMTNDNSKSLSYMVLVSHARLFYPKRIGESGA